MIYLDYSATTPTDTVVLQSFVKASEELFGNANSLHPLGIASKQAMDSATKKIESLFHVQNVDVIYTSGATEANNLAIKGIVFPLSSVGKHVILSPYEHSSVVAAFSELEKRGYDVDILPLHENGLVELSDVKNVLRNDTVLVSVCAVASETGMRQPVEEIAKLVHEYPNAKFHSDVTQAVGKVTLNYSSFDGFSFSAHKFYGIKGIGALVKKQNVLLEPLIVGGHSTTPFRSGTPSTPLVISMISALEIALSNQSVRYERIMKLRSFLEQQLSSLPEAVVNAKGIPHILNLSIVGTLSKQTQEELAKRGIMVSTQTACASERSLSQLIYQLTSSMDRAKSSIRISISHQTTETELLALVEALKGLLHS